ncbi:MAG: MarR family transcriptional regulator [Sphingobium sp.]|jgi:DNA-binding MarR family transcriptional regulator|nr:MarR family transcriptional regulator [Sphingobium sp.]MCP5398339.1 MarR family transcriptional regulator [Sphingomonas sp.]
MIRDQLIFGLGRLSALARQQEWRAGEDAGLTPTQGDALRLLQGRTEGLRLNQLAAQLSVRPSTASDAVSALVAKGLVKRLPDPENARAVRVSLTKAGHEMLGTVPDGHSSMVAVLSDAEVEVMHRFVLQTITRLQQAGQIAPQRMCVTCRYFVPESELEQPGRAYCNLIQAPLEPVDLRINCPEHEEKAERS